MKLSDLNSYTKAEIRALSAVRLAKLIQKAKDYYTKGKSPISDTLYDTLEDILRKKDPDNEVLKSVGAKATGRKKVKLPHPMYSLSKIKPEHQKQLDAWQKRYPGPVVVSDKEDGSSLEIVYANGVPHKVYTRGDGTVGQDVSHLIPVLRIPKRVPVKDLVVRAELAMSESAFAKHAADKYANARNLVAGMANRLNSEATLLKHAHVLAYEIIHPRMKPSQAFTKLEAMKFTCPPWRKLSADKVTMDVLSKLFLKARKSSDHAIDGLVIESDTVNKRPPAGTHSPSYAFAFKMQDADDAAQVVIESIDWEVTRHGKLQPVIVIPPTKLAGVTVKNVSGHNAYFIANGFRLKDAKKGMPVRPLGKGAVIRVVRSGDVIPHVVEVVKGIKKPEMPKVPYTWDSKGVSIMADGKSDLARDKRITNFFSTVGVDGIKLGTVSKLTEAGYTSIIKILRMSTEDMLEIPGFKERSAQKLHDSIRKSTQSVDLALLMDGSGFFGQGFGTSRATAIIKAYPDVLKRFEGKTPSQITAVIAKLPGFQEKTAALFGNGFAKFSVWLKKTKIKPAMPKKVKVTGAAMKGQSVCFTGFRSKELEQWIVENGGTIASGVSAKTTILVYAAGKSSSKLGRAITLGIKHYDEQAFRRKYKL